MPRNQCNFCTVRGHVIWDCAKWKKKKEKEAKESGSSTPTYNRPSTAHHLVQLPPALLIKMLEGYVSNTEKLIGMIVAHNRALLAENARLRTAQSSSPSSLERSAPPSPPVVAASAPAAVETADLGQPVQPEAKGPPAPASTLSLEPAPAPVAPLEPATTGGTAVVHTQPVQPVAAQQPVLPASVPIAPPAAEPSQPAPAPAAPQPIVPFEPAPATTDAPAPLPPPYAMFPMLSPFVPLAPFAPVPPEPLYDFDAAWKAATAEIAANTRREINEICSNIFNSMPPLFSQAVAPSTPAAPPAPTPAPPAPAPPTAARLAPAPADADGFQPASELNRKQKRSSSKRS